MNYPARYDVEYPERSARWKLVFWRIAATVPHCFVLAALTVSLAVLVPIGWLGVLFTGRFPRGLHQYIAGVFRWAVRVHAYVLSLTDEFPPFSLSPDAEAAGKNLERTALAFGVLAIGGFVAGLVLFVNFGGQHITREVSYQRLLARDLTAEESLATVHSGAVRLTAARDPADAIYAPLLRPQADSRFLEVELVIENQRGEGEKITVGTSSFSLKGSVDSSREPLLAMVDGKLAPAAIDAGHLATVRLLFEVGVGEDPSELRYSVLDYIAGVGETVLYKFY